MLCAAPGRWLGCGHGTRWARLARRAAPRRRHAPARRRRAAGAPSSPCLRPPPAAASGPPARAAPPCPRCTESAFGLCLSRHRRQPRRALQPSELTTRNACQVTTRDEVLAKQRARKKPCAGWALVTCWAARRRRSGTLAPTPATPAELGAPAMAAADHSRLRHPPLPAQFGAPRGRPHSVPGRLGCR